MEQYLSPNHRFFTNQKYVCYLLHFDNKYGRIRHYLGICKSSRFAQRMHDHSAGRGGRTTSRLIAVNQHFQIVELWSASDPSLERRLKVAGHYDAHCIYCARELDRSDFGTIPVIYDIHKKAAFNKMLKATSFNSASQP